MVFVGLVVICLIAILFDCLLGWVFDLVLVERAALHRLVVYF